MGMQQHKGSVRRVAMRGNYARIRLEAAFFPESFRMKKKVRWAN